MSHTQGPSSLEYRIGDQPVPGYTLVRELGRGAMGVVWLAQTDSGFERALKVINLRQRGGKKEYRGLRTIKQRKLLHGNLLTLIDYWLKDAEGRIIPDSDDLDNTDSFFAPKPGAPEALSLTQTTSQSVSATDTSPRSPTRQPPPPPINRGATMVSRATMAEMPSPPEPRGTGGAGKTVQPRSPEERPAQLIVAMELGHKTLDDRQKQCREDKLAGIPADELLPYMEQAARGLDYLHREGIIHRDIKPHNIMLVGDVAKVCDYGLVVTTDADLRSTSNAFTPLYASPEAVGEQPLTGRSDQYSLAVTYIELRTGRSPYASETAASVYAAKETGKYDLTRVHNKRVRTVLRRALARNPNERFGTCSEFIRELDTAESSRPAAVWLLVGLAALALLTVGAVISVPDLRDRLLPKRSEATIPEPQPRRTGDGEPTIPKTDVTEPPAKQLPPPAPELREIVEAARKLRLAGKFEEAVVKLDEAKIADGSSDSRHWPYQLERLSTEIGAQLDSPASVTADQWDRWRQQAEKLSDQSPGHAADGVLLAAMHLFSTTRLDPMSVPLSHSALDFARAMAGVNQWDQVLRADEQASLRALRDGLRQQLVATSQPLPTDWKENLRSIWSDREALQLLIDRVRRQFDAMSVEGLKATADDLDELAGQLVPSATDLEPQLVALRSDLKQNQQKLALAKLEPYWREDLTSSAVRMRLQTLLDSLGEAASSPLATLLRIEADLETGGSRRLTEHRNKLRSLLPELDRGGNPADRTLAEYARYLRARVEIQLNPNRPLEDIKTLLAWPATPQTDWHTESRGDQVAGMLLHSANTTLPTVRDGELDLFSASSDQISAVNEYLQKSKALRADSAACDGLQAIVAAIAAYQTNNLTKWKEVAESAAAALKNWGAVKEASLANRRPAVEYVGAIAVTRLKDQGATANLAALKVFTELLQRSFHEDSAAETNDSVVYSRIVGPALELRLDESDAATRELLSRIWLAKARLLERDSSYSLVGDAPGDKKDGYSRTMLAANKAFETARQLHESLNAATGFCRTLLKLSREDFVPQRKKYTEMLASIVERYNPAGNADNPALHMASGWVSWDNAMQESTRPKQIEAVTDSLRHYRAVISATTDRDPYGLNGLALFLSSNAHVQAAFWTPIAPSDLVNPTDEANLTDKDPIQMTKYDHLRRAVTLARSAELDENRGLPEEAFMSEANGLEDLAYYCKFTDNYVPATKAFENAVKAVGFSRSKVYALMSLGRCQFRWSRDQADASLTRNERVAKLREAYTTLKSAVDSIGTHENRDAAEANWWLAQTYEEAANNGPGDLAAVAGKNSLESETLDRLISIYGLKDSRRAVAEAELTQRLRNYEQSWRLAKHAADLANVSGPQDRVTYWRDSLFIGIELVRRLKQLDPQFTAVRRDELQGELLGELRKTSTQFLELSQRDPVAAPRSVALHALDVLSRANAGVKQLPENLDAGLASLKKWEVLFRDPDDRDKLIEVLIWEAGSGEGEAVLTRAEQLANQMAPGSSQFRALGRIYRSRADLRLVAIKKSVVEGRAAKAAGRPHKPIDPNSVKEVVEGYAQAEQLLARSKGDDVVASLERLRQQPLKDLPGVFEGNFSSNLELHRLREFIVESSAARNDAVDATIGWFGFLGLEKELSDETRHEKPAAQARPMLKQLRDFLKPRSMLREGGLTRDQRSLVDLLEYRLKL